MTQQPRDRIVQLQKQTITRDSFGSEVVTWVDHLGPQWASFRSMRGKETFVSQADRLLASRHGTWGILYREDVTELMRVVDGDGREWDILGIAQVGYRRGLELQCRSTSP